MKNSTLKKLIIIGIVALILIIGYFRYKSQHTSLTLPEGGINITLNDSIDRIQLFCQDLEEKLIASKIWNTQQWKCVVAYDEGYNTTDIIYNKTRGLCNCTATFDDGTQKSVEVRQSK